MYGKTKNERESNSKSSYSSTRQGNVKRLLVLLMITISLMFAGAQSAPTTQANAFCELVCGEPFIDPNSGQCVQMCCPQEEECKSRCELRPCKALK